MQLSVCWAFQNHWTHEPTAAVVTCTRATEGQAKKKCYGTVTGRYSLGTPLTGELLAVYSCWGRENLSFSIYYMGISYMYVMCFGQIYAPFCFFLLLLTPTITFHCQCHMFFLKRTESTVCCQYVQSVEAIYFFESVPTGVFPMFQWISLHLYTCGQLDGYLVSYQKQMTWSLKGTHLG